MFKSRKESISTVPSLPTSGFLAKTYSSSEGVLPGRKVEDHCRIVGEVAKALVRRYPPLVQALFPKGAELAAACHDVGKISPTFYEKIRQACTKNAPPGLDKSVDPASETIWGGHAGVSQATAQFLEAPRYVPEILGMHHGFSPQLGGKTAEAEPFGGFLWQQERIKLIEYLKNALQTDWPNIQDDARARVVAGLTTVADWIGSGRHFEDPSVVWDTHLIEKAVTESGFVAPTYQANLSFESIFGFKPHAAQERLMQAAASPGLYVLEAPMGMGKTEAALYVAYTMLQRGQASGVYFALPTQLTSNKIYERFNAFLERIIEPNCPHKEALLLHGNAWLIETEMGEEGRPGGSWFSQSKRGLLAPFAVGTIDQALMAAMHVKHGFVRALGLAGKVVILDEVHTYDAYTGTLLDALVGLLRRLECTVIVLSATLNSGRRGALIGQAVTDNAYPLITRVDNENSVCEIAVDPPQNVEVQIQLVNDTKRAIEEAFQRACSGQFVLWLENTVSEAQERYLDFAARAGDANIPCGLLHSRFTVADRSKKENEWVHAFGKQGWVNRLSGGRILVGTQVLEQSLDIDADFLITRFAPTDMLMQRLGRLWRHADTPRAVGAVRQAWLLAPDVEQATENPKKSFGATAAVYAPYVLCRSLMAWQQRKHVMLPGDIRKLVEATYCEQVETGKMFQWQSELKNGTPGPRGRRGTQALQQLARIGLAQAGKTLPESQAQTRYSETESCQVLIVRSLREEQVQRSTWLTLLDGKTMEIPHQRHRLTKNEWKQCTSQLMENMVPVGAYTAPKALCKAHAKALGLGHCFYLGDPNDPDDENALHLVVLDQVNLLQSIDFSSVHDKFLLGYRDDLGYTHTST